MNKHLYRLVFSRARGMLVAVEETARGAGKGDAAGAPGDGGARGDGGTRGLAGVRRALVQALRAAWPWSATAGLVLVLVPLSWGATPLPDAQAPAGQRPGVTGSTAGVPVVQITAPNGAGLSVNKFSDFSFSHGVVLNNSKVDGVSATAGALPKNPNLAGGNAAQVGLMEVTGGVPSQLAGTMEVFGQKMAVFVANPNGITVGSGATGLATLNVSRLTLSTGVPVIGADGSLQGLRVGQGSITTQGTGGVDTDGLDYFGLQALSVVLNSPVGSNDATRLQVVGGPSYVDARTQAVQPLTGAAQGFGISASALGSMRGGQIELISTGAGVGVRHEGVITSAADLSVSADGDVQLRQLSSSAGQVQVRTPGQLTLQGDVSGRSVVLSAGSLQQDDAQIVSSGADAGALAPGVTLRVRGAYQLQGHYVVLDAQGQELAGAQVRLRNGVLGVVDASGAPIAGAQIASSAGVQSHGTIQIEAGSLTNTQGLLRSDSSATSSVEVGGALDNEGLVQAAGGNLRVDAGSLVNAAQGPGVIAADGTLALGAGSLVNAAQGGLVAGSDLTLGSASYANRGIVRAARDLWLATDSYVNSGSVLSGRDATLQITDGHDLDLSAQAQAPVAAGTLHIETHDLALDTLTQSPGDIVVDASGDVDNRQVLASGGRLAVHAGGRLRNEPGAVLLAMGDVSLDAGTLLDNASAALVQSQGDMVLSAPQVLNEAAAQMSAQGNLDVYTATLNNEAALTGGIQNGAVQTGGGRYTDSDAGTLRFDYYTLAFQGPTLESTLTQSDPGVLQAGKDLTVHGGAGSSNTTNNAGRILAAGNALIEGALHNVQPERDEDLATYLKNTGSMTLQVSPRNSTFGSALASTGDFSFASMYDFLDGMFGQSSPNGYDASMYHYGYDKAIAALASLDVSGTAPMLQQVLAQALGSGWKSESYVTLQAQWSRFVGQPPVLRFLATNPGQVVSGANLTQTGGALSNGSTVATLSQQLMDTQVGTQTVSTVQGQMAARMGTVILSQAPDTLAELALLNPRLVHIGAANPAGGVQPLYHTSLDVVDQGQFYGTAEFLALLGVNATTSQATLLDNYLTDQLLQGELRREGADSLLIEQYGVGGTALIKQLMDNAAAQARVLGLVVGQAPSEPQLARLGAPLVWYVTQSVDGQQMLVPQLYLDAGTLARARARQQGGALLSAGGALSADASSIDNVDGTIEGAQGVRLHSAGDLRNVAAAGLGANGIRSQQGSVSLSAAGDLRNQGATIAGQSVTLTAGGTLSLADSVGLDAAGDSVLEGTQVTATHALSLSAGKDIELQAAAVRGHDVRLSAGGAIHADTVTLASSTASSELRTGSWGHSIRNASSVSAQGVGSLLAAAADGTLSMHAAGDIVLTGGSYRGGHADLQAGGALKLVAARRDSHAQESVSSVSWNGSASTGLGNHQVTASWNSESGSSTSSSDSGSPVNTSSIGQGGNNPPGGDIGSGSFGLQVMSTSASDNSTHYTNASLDFTGNARLASGQTIDIGGADLAAGGRLEIIGAKVASTKYDDTSTVSKDSSTLTIGAQGSLSSAVDQVVNDVASQVQQQRKGGTFDAGSGAMQAVTYAGDATNVLYGSLGNATAGFGISGRHERSTQTGTSENITHLKAADVSITSTAGGIELHGVQSSSGGLTLQSAAGIDIEAARSTTQSSSSSDSWSVTQQANAQVGGAAQGASAGVGASLNVGYDHSSSSEQDIRYTNSTLQADHVRVAAVGQLALQGANVKARQVTLDVGSLKISSVQDTTHAEGKSGGFNVSAGVALNSKEGVAPMGSIGMNAGSSSVDGASVAEQSGIDASGVLRATVRGDASLTGAHITGGAGSSLRVGGRLTASALQDSYSASSRQGGFSAGMSADGSVFGSVTGGQGPSKNTRTTQNATLAGVQLAARGGVSGALGTDASQESVQTLNQTLVGSTATFTGAYSKAPKTAGSRQARDSEPQSSRAAAYESVALDEPQAHGSSLLTAAGPSDVSPEDLEMQVHAQPAATTTAKATPLSLRGGGPGEQPAEETGRESESLSKQAASGQQQPDAQPRPDPTTLTPENIPSTDRDKALPNVQTEPKPTSLRGGGPRAQEEEQEESKEQDEARQDPRARLEQLNAPGGDVRGRSLPVAQKRLENSSPAQKDFPYYSSKRPVDINNNGKVAFPDGMDFYGRSECVLWCRDIASDVYRQYSGAAGEKVDFSRYQDLEKLREIDVNDYGRILRGNYLERPVIYSDDFGKFLAGHVGRMQAAGLTTDALLINTVDHVLAGRVQLKMGTDESERADGRIVASVYDPNVTATHKRVSVAGIDELEKFTLKDFLKDDSLAKLYFSFSPKVDIFSKNAILGDRYAPDEPSGNFARELLLHSTKGDSAAIRSMAESIYTIGKNIRREEQRDNSSNESSDRYFADSRVLSLFEFDKGLDPLRLAIDTGSAESIQALSQVYQAAGLKSSTLKLILLDRRSPTSFSRNFEYALDQGSPETIRAVGRLAKNLLGDDHAAFASFLDSRIQTGQNPFQQVMYYGHADRVRALGDVLFDAGISDEKLLDRLMNATRKGTNSALHMAVVRGHVDAVQAWGGVVGRMGIQDSALLQELLAGQSVNSVPALHESVARGDIAMSKALGEAVRAALDGRAAGDATDNVDIARNVLAAKSASGTPALHAAMSSGSVEGIKAFGEAVRASGLKDEGALQELFLARDSEGNTAAYGAIRGDHPAALQAWGEEIRKLGLQDPDKLQTLLEGRDRFSNTAMYRAVAGRREDWVRTLGGLYGSSGVADPERLATLLLGKPGMSSGVLHQALARGTPDLIRALGEGVRQAGLSDPALFARMLGDNESSFESPIIGALSSGKPENVKAFADLASTLGIVDPTSLARILVPPADYLKAFGTAETVAALEQVLQKAGIPRISPFDASGNPKTEQASVAVEGRQENVDKAKPRASKRKCLPCGW